MKLKKKTAAVTAVIFLCVLGMALPAPPVAAEAPSREQRPLKAHFIDVGHGDACLVQCPGGENILIDGGAGFDWGGGGYNEIVNDYLRSRGVTGLDLVIATHPHSDHVGGLTAVLKEFPAKMVLDSGKEHTTKSYRNYLEAVKTNPDTKFKIAKAGQLYEFGGVKIRVLHPGGTLLKKMNDCSVVCRLEYGKASFLFTGDAEVKAEQEIMGRGYPLRSTVLKVGHHGNESSSSASFIRKVKPKVAVISCAPRKSLVHGDSKVLDRLKKAGASIYRTDERSTVIIESDGSQISIKVIGK